MTYTRVCFNGYIISKKFEVNFVNYIHLTNHPGQHIVVYGVQYRNIYIVKPKTAERLQRHKTTKQNRDHDEPKQVPRPSQQQTQEKKISEWLSRVTPCSVCGCCASVRHIHIGRYNI